jgi:hypothetical protein
MAELETTHGKTRAFEISGAITKDAATVPMKPIDSKGVTTPRVARRKAPRVANWKSATWNPSPPRLNQEGFNIFNKSMPPKLVDVQLPLRLLMESDVDAKKQLFAALCDFAAFKKN